VHIASSTFLMPKETPLPSLDREENRRSERALVVRDLSVTYSRTIRALDRVSLSIPPASIVSLLGANGAGKSSLLRAISGTLPVHGGSVVNGTIAFGDLELQGKPSGHAVRAGIVQVPEGRRVFARLTVLENLHAGALGAQRRSRSEVVQRRDLVFSLFPNLADRREQAAGLLSGGEQQMLAMGRAMMANPRLLLLDEPSLGLAPQMVTRIGEIIRTINQMDVGVLLVEQNAAMALELAEHAYVLDVGRIRLDGAAADLAQSDEVRRLYLGGAPEPTDQTTQATAGALATLTRWAR
jgi:branched-chain amino acid transport system ATP-binding protein